MMRLRSVRAADNVLSLAIALVAVLTVLALYFGARHHFLTLRETPRVVFVGNLPETHAGIRWSLGFATSGSREVPIAQGKLAFSVPAAQPLRLHGWLVDSVAAAPALGFMPRTDFGASFNAVYGISRPDVAAAVCAPCTNSGFTIDFPANTIPPGIHKLRLTAVRADGSALYVSPQPIVFRITR